MSSTTRDHNTEESVARALAAVEEERGHPSTTQDVFGNLDLRNAYNNLLSRNQELTHALTRVKQGGESKNTARTIKKRLIPSDRFNVSIANTKIDTDIWSYNPIRPRAWYHWSVNPRSFANKIMECGLRVPAGVESKDYWETILVRAVNDKYTYTKSNLIQALLMQYKGKRCCGFIYYCTFYDRPPNHT